MVVIMIISKKLDRDYFQK